MEHREGWTDEQFDIVLVYVLRVGVLGIWPLPSPVAAWCFLARHGLERPV